MASSSAPAKRPSPHSAQAEHSVPRVATPRIPADNPPGPRAHFHGPVKPAFMDAASDQTTEAFVRRILCPQQMPQGSAAKERARLQPIDELLPPLTSSNEVDLQLYAIIAVIIRDHVDPWFSKITPDRGFVEELVRIIAHCTRAFEQRLRKVDLEVLLLDELPALLEAHLSGRFFSPISVPKKLGKFRIRRRVGENKVLCALRVR